MTDTWVILASLDRFIERFGHHEKLMNDHRVATQCQPVATSKPLTNQGNNHSAILATQNKSPSPEPITNDVTHTQLPPKIRVRAPRVKSHLSMVTVARVASPFQIKSLPVAIGKMPMAIVVSPFQISSLRAV
jgi:hypothetical protein